MKINKINNHKIDKKYGYEVISTKKLLSLGSGDDSVLIDLGRVKTIQEVNKELDKLYLKLLLQEKFNNFCTTLKKIFTGKLKK